MASYSRDTIVRAARDCGMTPNSHILGRKDVHPNILRNYATSVLKDDSLVKNSQVMLSSSIAEEIQKIGYLLRNESSKDCFRLKYC